MKKVAPGNRLLLKAICLGLALTLGANLIAAGVMAASGCDMKCCCLNKPISRHHAPGEQIRSAMGCCSRTAQLPCDLAAATREQLPKICLAASTGHLSTGIGPANPISNAVVERHGFRGPAFDQLAREKLRLPPLYLQNLSFLI